jgi:hypothetical protein
MQICRTDRQTFDLGDTIALPPLSAVGPDEGSGMTRHISTYFDTDELALVEAGVVLRRLDTTGGWELRVPRTVGGQTLVRSSSEDAEPPADLLRAAVAFFGTALVAPVLTVDVERDASACSTVTADPCWR